MSDVEETIAERRVRVGQEHPYDGVWNDDELQPLRHADDPAYQAARGIAYDIGDRAVLKWEWEKVDADVRPTIIDDFAAIIKAATTKPDTPVCVEVRELEWENHPASAPDEPDAWIAETSFGEYEIIHWLDGTYRCIRANRPVGKAFPTLEDAQAACQADFTRRTLELVNARSVEDVKAETVERCAKALETESQNHDTHTRAVLIAAAHTVRSLTEGEG